MRRTKAKSAPGHGKVYWGANFAQFLNTVFSFGSSLSSILDPSPSGTVAAGQLFSPGHLGQPSQTSKEPVVISRLWLTLAGYRLGNYFVTRKCTACLPGHFKVSALTLRTRRSDLASIVSLFNGQ